jgi:hypothetical protein
VSQPGLVTRSKFPAVDGEDLVWLKVVDSVVNSAYPFGASAVFHAFHDK